MGSVLWLLGLCVAASVGFVGGAWWFSVMEDNKRIQKEKQRTAWIQMQANAWYGKRPR